MLKNGYAISKKKVPGVDEKKFQAIFREFHQKSTIEGIKSYMDYKPDVLVAYDGGYVTISLEQRQAMAVEGLKHTAYSISEESREELIKLLLWNFPLDKHLMKSL